MGHSFGTGAALQFAARHRVEGIVLVAPFNTLRKGVAVKSLFLALVMPAQIDNREIIRQLLSDEEPPEITIMHGAKDASLPVSMGRELAAIDPDRINYLEFPEDDHTSILTTRRDLIFGILNGG
jgi:pimeloyl-ACP methyl ester carboxylesterase